MAPEGEMTSHHMFSLLFCYLKRWNFPSHVLPCFTLVFVFFFWTSLLRLLLSCSVQAHAYLQIMKQSNQHRMPDVGIDLLWSNTEDKPKAKKLHLKVTDSFQLSLSLAYSAPACLLNIYSLHKSDKWPHQLVFPNLCFWWCLVLRVGATVHTSVGSLVCLWSL
jgi:hypothetical protein